MPSINPSSERQVLGHAPSAAVGAAQAPAVRIRGLTKVYRHPWTMRSVVGLEPLDLEVQRGEVFGYLGPNGAGKTTTLKILTGLLKPSAGEAHLLGESIERVSSRARLGFLPEQPYFFDHLNGIEYLEFAARLSGMHAHEATHAARGWFARVGLSGRERLALRKFSKGMLQRLGLAAALVHAPDVVILDEPMSGLDPFGRRDVRDLILEQRQRGVTVLFSSHILPDVELLCDRVAILLKGRLERVATVSELTEQSGGRVEIRCASGVIAEWPEQWQLQLERRDGPGETIFVLEEPGRLQEVLEHLLRQRVEVRAVTPHRRSLEELFMAAAEGAAIQAQPAAGERRSA